MGYAPHILYIQAFRTHGSHRTGITRQIVARKVKQLMKAFIAKVIFPTRTSASKPHNTGNPHR